MDHLDNPAQLGHCLSSLEIGNQHTLTLKISKQRRHKCQWDPPGQCAIHIAHVASGDCSNATVVLSVRSNLTTILGRMAAYRKGEATWDEMIKANERWEFGARGMKG